MIDEPVPTMHVMVPPIWPRMRRNRKAKACSTTRERLAAPSIGAVAVAALGYGLLSRPANVQPARKPSAHEAQASSTPVYVATPVHASSSPPTPASAPPPAPAPLVEPPKAADVPGAFVRQVVD